MNGAPAFAPDRQSAAAQAGQFGYNCDYLAVPPGRRRQLVMVANHEYTDEVLMFAGYDPENPTREQFEIALAAHGMSVVVLDEDRRSPELKVAVGHELNRRITGSTPIQFTGPAAGSCPPSKRSTRSASPIRPADEGTDRRAPAAGQQASSIVWSADFSLVCRLSSQWCLVRIHILA